MKSRGDKSLSYCILCAIHVQSKKWLLRARSNLNLSTIASHSKLHPKKRLILLDYAYQIKTQNRNKYKNASK